jgi:quinol-cytochrome oxidoreductase complex cytochrome b subunit
MKNERIIWIMVVLLISITALTSFSGSRYRVHWDGTRYWGFKTFGKTEGGDFIYGRLENKRTVYIVGPISVWLRHD